ncbi:MAG: hypothetical protein FWE38_00715 [Firmicutes bacterium]|nr:hypothetical protein [Bacillota bacterium]
MTNAPKFIVFVAGCAALLVWHFGTMGNPQLETLGNGEFRIYSRELVNSPLVERRIDIALGHVYITSSHNAAALRAKFNHIDGESIRLPRTNASEILNRLGHHVVSTQQIHAGHITYAHNTRGRDFITSDGRRINLQIVERAHETIVGWPILLGGY